MSDAATAPLDAPLPSYQPRPGWPREHMMEAALGLLCSAEPSGVLPDPQVWRDAVMDWIAEYHDLARGIGRGAVVEIVERAPANIIAGIDDSHGIITPNQVRINGMPLMVAEGGPVVERIESPSGDPVLVTLTLFARRVVIDAEPTDAP